MLNRVSVILIFLFNARAALAQDWNLLFGLEGEWRFEIGDNMSWRERDFDDSKWAVVHAPREWEDEGFPGYDGYAWYRKHFQAQESWRGKSLFLHLGTIDDVDEVYVNGTLIGRTGSFWPDYQTAYSSSREYPLPESYLRIPGDNVIAVRVYDEHLSGGIVGGPLGVFADMAALRPEIDLAGKWHFKPGDDMRWKEPTFDERSWEKMLVPAYWELHGHTSLDGYAWYRLRFTVPSDLADKRLILVLGNIDDFDETYLNGDLIGRTGTMGRVLPAGGSDDYLKLRAYTIPANKLLFGKENVLAVRVFDGFRDGGIYRGPIGIVTRDRYIKWERQTRRSKRSFFDWLLN